MFVHPIQFSLKTKKKTLADGYLGESTSNQKKINFNQLHK